MDTETMYVNLQSDLIRFARSISRHEQEADDLVQDALEKSLKETALLELPIYKQRAWFFRVMKNRLIDDRRKDKRLSDVEASRMRSRRKTGKPERSNPIWIVLITLFRK